MNHEALQTARALGRGNGLKTAAHLFLQPGLALFGRLIRAGGLQEAQIQGDRGSPLVLGWQDG